MRWSSRSGVVLVAIAAIACTACGSSSASKSGAARTATTTAPSGAGGAAKKVDVCKIITPADAESVVGGAVEEQAPPATESLASGVCIYKASGGGIRVSLLQVRVYPGPQFYGEQALDETKRINIAGADKAFVQSSSEGTSVDVQFVKDGKTGTINYTDTGKATGGDATLHAVETVAEKLAAAL